MKIKIIKPLLLLTILSLYILNVKSGNTNYISLFLISFTLFILITINLKNKLIISRSFKWYFKFSVFSIMSFLYSIEPINSINMIPTFIINLMIIFIITNYINSKEHLINVIKIIAICGFINSLVLLFASSYTNVDTYNRVGTGIGNVNLIAIQICYSLIFSFILIKYTNKKLKYIIMISFMGVSILFTGARQVFLMICVFLLAWLFLKDYKNIVKNMRNIIIGIIVISILLVLIMKVDFLYMLLGSRIEEMLHLLSGQNVAEHSLNSRANMIKSGIEWFKSSPILGYGIDTYKVMYNNSFGVNYYAHNNYIEILVDLGLIGCVTYYVFYFKLLKNLYKFKLHENYTACILFCLVIAQFFLDIAFVSYGSRILIIIVSIIERYVYLNNIDIERKKYGISINNNVDI